MDGTVLAFGEVTVTGDDCQEPNGNGDGSGTAGGGVGQDGLAPTGQNSLPFFAGAVMLMVAGLFVAFMHLRPAFGSR